MLVDSHCHLDRLDLTLHQGDVEYLLGKAEEAGVKYFLCPGVTLEQIPDILHLAHTHKNIVASIGLHPTEDLSCEPTVEQLCELANDPRVVGIGETGLDYADCSEDKITQELQQRIFITHVRAARALGKPLIIHSRMAKEDILRILKTEDAQSIGGVLHCFTEDLPMAREAITMNFYIAFSGIITFKNADSLREVARQIPLDKMLLETDAPYLAPVPYRGKPNTPEYLPYIAECIAKLRNITVSELASVTTENFFRLFKLFL